MRTVRVVKDAGSGFGAAVAQVDAVVRLAKGAQPPEGSRIVQVLPDGTPERDWRSIFHEEGPAPQEESE